MSLTGAFTKELGNQLNFCIKDSDNDWNQAFKFSSDLRFLVNCIKQKGCFKKSSCTCKPNSSNEDITIFGALVMVALCLLLLIIYNFSGQVLSNRERRQAKSREAAARSARETVQARERWKSAKDVAKKHVVGLQAQLSRTFSRKTSKGLTISRGPFDVSSSKNLGFFSKKKEPSNLTKMIQSLKENPESDEGFNLQIGDKNVMKNMPKGKQMHTRSQIFKYAYDQIEKEKALEQKKIKT